MSVETGTNNIDQTNHPLTSDKKVAFTLGQIVAIFASCVATIVGLGYFIYFLSTQVNKISDLEKKFNSIDSKLSVIEELIRGESKLRKAHFLYNYVELPKDSCPHYNILEDRLYLIKCADRINGTTIGSANFNKSEPVANSRKKQTNLGSDESSNINKYDSPNKIFVAQKDIR